MQPGSFDSSVNDDEESMLIPSPVANPKRSVGAGGFGLLVVMALCAYGLSPSSPRERQQRSDEMWIISLNEDKAAEKFKRTIHRRIEGFANICEECRKDSKKYYGGKLDQVTKLEKKCDNDASTCDDVKKKIDELRDEVDGAWSGSKCPDEMPVSCKITSKCKPFPKQACVPHTCKPINLLKSFGRNNKCAHASMECDGQEKVSLSPDDMEAEEFKQLIHTRIEGFAHICKECRTESKKYYGAKLDEVTVLEKKCEDDETTCDDVKQDMDRVMDEVNGAWDGSTCPKEMPVSCTISSSCNPFPKKACAPHTCKPINLLKSFGKNNKCTDATMECDGQEKVSLKDKV